MTAIELHVWPTPNGQKIFVILEELGLDYNINWVDITKGDQFKPDFLKIAPNNRIPAIIDPDGPDDKEITIFESGAILQYLGRKTGQFYPTDERKRVAVEEWLMWQMGGFGPMLGQAHHFRQFAPEKVPYAIKRYTEETARLYGVLDRRLADAEYVAGDYSIADMSMIGWAKAHERQGQDFKDFPNVKRWYDLVTSRDAVKKALSITPPK